MIKCLLWTLLPLAVIVGLACGSDPTPTLRPTPTPRPTPIPTPNFKPVLQDNFSNSNSGWDERTSSGSVTSYEAGEYRIRIKESNIVSWDTSPQWFTDFDVQVQARYEVPRIPKNYGLIFRYQNSDNFYSFVVDPSDGDYALHKLEEGSWHTIIGWKRSSAIKRGDRSNLLRVVARGSEIHLYTNGEWLSTTNDSTFESGLIGLIASSSSDPGGEAYFDNLKAYEISMEHLASDGGGSSGRDPTRPRLIQTIAASIPRTSTPSPPRATATAVPPTSPPPTATAVPPTPSPTYPDLKYTAENLIQQGDRFEYVRRDDPDTVLVFREIWEAISGVLDLDNATCWVDTFKPSNYIQYDIRDEWIAGEQVVGSYLYSGFSVSMGRLLLGSVGLYYPPDSNRPYLAAYTHTYVDEVVFIENATTIHSDTPGGLEVLTDYEARDRC